MPTGVYERTEETRRKIGEATKDRPNGMLGKHHSKETKDKMRFAKLGERNPNYGKHHSEETRKIMSLVKLGKPSNMLGKHQTEEAKEKDRIAQIGKHHSLKTKQKISRALKVINCGENNPNWKGGISFEPYTSEFNEQLKELIRNRDGYKCQLCGMPEIENIKKLSIHHIDYIKKNCLPNNLITLCRGCNNKVNSNRDFWEKYFKEIRRKYAEEE